MTKLGIIGAMQEEIETLLHLMEKKTEKEKIRKKSKFFRKKLDFL